MDKNPFSLYDFMGYLFPGCLSLLIFAYFNQLDWNIYRIASVDNLKQMIEFCNKITWESFLLIVVMGYTIGHIIAYLSSLTIEILFTNKIFGYPSVYLFNKKRKTYREVWISYWASDTEYTKCFINVLSIFMKYLLKSFVVFLIFPVAFIVMTIGWISGLNAFIVRPLDGYLQKTLNDKQYKLAERLKITHPNVNENCDYHRIVMHYVYLNLPESQVKTNNYLALYGFLRSLTFVICVAFGTISILAINTIDFSTEFCWNIWYLLVVLFILPFLLYLEFVKFYRRFTLENLMSLLVGMPDDVNNSSII